MLELLWFAKGAAGLLPMPKAGDHPGDASSMTERSGRVREGKGRGERDRKWKAKRQLSQKGGGRLLNAVSTAGRNNCQN